MGSNPGIFLNIFYFIFHLNLKILYISCQIRKIIFHFYQIWEDFNHKLGFNRNLVFETDFSTTASPPRRRRLLMRRPLDGIGTTQCFIHVSFRSVSVFSHGGLSSFCILSMPFIGSWNPCECQFFWKTIFDKDHIFWEGHKIFRNLHLTFVLCSASQK